MARYPKSASRFGLLRERLQTQKISLRTARNTPCTITILTERPLRLLSKESLPIDVLFRAVVVYVVIPFPVKRVAAVRPLRPQWLADRPLRRQLSRPMMLRLGCILAAHLQRASR